MRRQRALLVYALGALGRRGGRNGAIVVGLALVVGLYASVTFLTDALRHEFSLGVDAAPDLTVQRVIAGRPALLDPDALRAFERAPAVRSVRPRVWGYLYLPSLSANVTVIGLRDGAHTLTVPPRLVEGRMPRAQAEMALGAELASKLGLRVGDRIALPRPGGFLLLRVVGVFRAETALYTADVVLTPEAEARTLLGVPDDRVTDVAVDLTNADEASALAARIADALPGSRILERDLLRRTYALTFDARGGLVAAALLPCLAALLLLAWERLTGLGEVERREIGVLKAVGWETSDVLAARVWESGIVALFGTGLGLVLGYLYVFVFGAPGLAPTLFGWSALYPPLHLTPSIAPAEIASILGGVVVPFVAVSIVPAWRAAMLDPDAAMRGTP